MSSTTSLYRSILCELRKSAVSPRPERSRAIITHLREALTNPRISQAQRQQDALNALTFLHSQRSYEELLVRYNPLHDMTPEERVKATARRVGLDVPVEAEEDSLKNS
ncbi:hypothetical protein DACRYDRAFT_105542 [Dacryopinax primogenitus]|uniref:Uncharacterized protein n=1 Tax=Dacryopinax primogenitus (strain DJM 731) TaxID=1858805 RepID=M5GFV8_DACPD|nr:uncharacterized protein DACRYDRAFT_105542 [Dacryopinax primogenitus]EJU04483.1 hypothetical protein DACRYDRAFT_105542 [Dacryopinax primogenitus]